MKTIAAQEEMLFQEWKRKYPLSAGIGFFRDGVPSPDVYLGTKVRTIFVLREANFGGHQKDYDFREELRNSPHPFWKQKVAPWCFGLANHTTGVDEIWSRARSIKDDKGHCIEVLNQFGYIQIKKAPGHSVAKASEVEQFARDDKDLIRRQVAVYRPNVMIACGLGHPNTFNLLLGEVFNCPSGGQRIPETGSRYAEISDPALSPDSIFVIEAPHPSHRSSREKAFRKLVTDFRWVVKRHIKPLESND